MSSQSALGKKGRKIYVPGRTVFIKDKWVGTDLSNRCVGLIREPSKTPWKELCDDHRPPTNVTFVDVRQQKKEPKPQRGKSMPKLETSGASNEKEFVKTTPQAKIKETTPPISNPREEERKRVCLVESPLKDPLFKGTAKAKPILKSVVSVPKKEQTLVKEKTCSRKRTKPMSMDAQIKRAKQQRDERLQKLAREAEAREAEARKAEEREAEARLQQQEEVETEQPMTSKMADFKEIIEFEKDPQLSSEEDEFNCDE